MWNIVCTSPPLLRSFSFWVYLKQNFIQLDGAATTSLVVNRNTQQKADVEKKKDNVKRNRIIKLRASTKMFSHCVYHWTQTQMPEEREEELLVTLQLDDLLDGIQTSLLLFLQYIQLSVNPMRDQAVHPEENIKAQLKIVFAEFRITPKFIQTCCLTKGFKNRL